MHKLNFWNGKIIFYFRRRPIFLIRNEIAKRPKFRISPEIYYFCLFESRLEKQKFTKISNNWIFWLLVDRSKSETELKRNKEFLKRNKNAFFQDVFNTNCLFSLTRANTHIPSHLGCRTRTLPAAHTRTHAHGPHTLTHAEVHTNLSDIHRKHLRQTHAENFTLLGITSSNKDWIEWIAGLLDCSEPWE